MEQSGGQIAAKLPKPPDGGADRLSALPDEILVLILEGLDTTAEAARTSVLARRWRSLWPLLSKLRFQLGPGGDGDRIRELLDVADAPELRYISVTTKGAAADSATAWLPAAARRLVGGLAYRNMASGLENDEVEEEARRGGTVQLPCFEKATTVDLELRFLGLALPSLGVFTRLTDLFLISVEFRGPCELSDVVSSPRCPCLQNLSIGYSWGLGNLSIHSESLLQMNLMYCDLRQLTIVTPLLQKLCVHNNFPSIAGDQSEQSVNITAPQIVSLIWKDQYDPRYFHLGNLGQTRKLETSHFYVYGERKHREHNHSCLKLLQQFKVLDSLHLSLILDLDSLHLLLGGTFYYQYLLGDITALPRITFLHLYLYGREHAFGASLFDLLRMCISLRRLSLVLYDRSNLKYRISDGVLPSFVGRSCMSIRLFFYQPNWKTDELVLDHLEDVHIIGLLGVEHEVVFVQRFLGWASVLKSLRITLCNGVTEGKSREFREALAGFSRPETCIQFDTFDKK